MMVKIDKYNAVIQWLDDKIVDKKSVAVKCNICINGVNITAASDILRDYVPRYDADVITCIKASKNFQIVCTTNMDEFGMGSTTTNSIYGPTLNPRNKEYSCGGSSGGSAVCVAAGLTDVALGSDTGGSVRLPIALCGGCCFVNSYSRLSRYGLLAFGNSLEQIGLMANNLQMLFEFCECLFSSTQCNDQVVRKILEIPYLGKLNILSLNTSILKTFGVSRELCDSLSLVQNLARSENTLIYEDRLLSVFERAQSNYFEVSSIEALSNLSRYDHLLISLMNSPNAINAQNYAELRTEYRKKFGTEVQYRLSIGKNLVENNMVEEVYNKRKKLKDEIDSLNADIIITPAVLSNNLLATSSREVINQNEIFLQLSNLIGWCSMILSVQGYPIQIMSNSGNDKLLLNFAAWLDKRIHEN